MQEVTSLFLPMVTETSGKVAILLVPCSKHSYMTKAKAAGDNSVVARQVTLFHTKSTSPFLFTVTKRSDKMTIFYVPYP